MCIIRYDRVRNQALSAHIHKSRSLINISVCKCIFGDGLPFIRANCCFFARIHRQPTTERCASATALFIRYAIIHDITIHRTVRHRVNTQSQTALQSIRTYKNHSCMRCVHTHNMMYLCFIVYVGISIWLLYKYISDNDKQRWRQQRFCRQQQQQQRRINERDSKISFHVVEFEVSASAMNNTFGCV